MAAQTKIMEACPTRPRRRPRPRFFERKPEDKDEDEDEKEPAMRIYFDHEKLDVYRLELSFVSWVTPLLAKVKQHGSSARTAEVIDQLDRASLSALLNTAEGNGRRQRQTRAKFFDDARGSVTECTACLDALVAKSICAENEIEEGKQLLLRIASMLTKLIALFESSSSSSSSSIVREEADEDEDEKENEKKDENEEKL
jgi:four helix bundle protein